MAVDGWASDGTPRLICLDPPGGDGGDGAGSFVANTFLGYPWPAQPASPAMPSVTPGTGDFSMELWARGRFGISPAADSQYYSIIAEEAFSGPFVRAGFRWGSTSVAANFDALGQGAPATIAVGATARVLGVWNHYAINFDRNANMEIFIDSESRGTVDISAQADSVTGEVHPLTGDHFTGYHTATFVNWSSIAIFPVTIGPFAIHSRLMTNAEIENSFRNKKVQNISSVSLLNFDWSKIEGQTGWDVDFDNMMLGHKAGNSAPAGAPHGAVGTVTVPDQSGNGNHWTLQTVEDYTAYDAAFSPEDGKWPLAFGADPFFR